MAASSMHAGKRLSTDPQTPAEGGPDLLRLATERAAKRTQCCGADRIKTHPRSERKG